MHAESLRIGFGTDIHALTAGGGLMLGGVLIPCALTAQAVSDGDVLLHALVDAMLGCAGLGDIGDHFPETAVRPGEASARFVRESLFLLRQKGLRIVNADCVVDLEGVKLGGLKTAIRDSIAGLLEVDSGRVNVKAKTAEGMGAVGEGNAVAAQVALLATVSL